MTSCQPYQFSAASWSRNTGYNHLGKLLAVRASVSHLNVVAWKAVDAVFTTSVMKVVVKVTGC